MFVIDASAILSWCFEDERADNADALMRRLVRGGMVAPSHFPLEVVNTLRVTQRRKRVTPQEAAAFVALLEALRIEIDQQNLLTRKGQRGGKVHGGSRFTDPAFLVRYC